MGDVEIGPEVSIWPHASIRADMGKIRIGEGTSVQDGVIIHTDPGVTVDIGKHVALGHGAIIHGASVRDRVIVGMGSILLDGATIGSWSIVAAGALVTRGTQVPEGSLVIGVPAKVVPKGDALKEAIRTNAAHYADVVAAYRRGEIRSRGT
jgi:carbonic anhydrase/acetyltransferase-like protein (isoleucine patch superfamily)